MYRDVLLDHVKVNLLANVIFLVFFLFDSEEDFQCHRVSNYRTTFFEIARKTTYRDDDVKTRSADVTITDAIFPISIGSVCLYTIGEPFLDIPTHSSH